MVVLTIFATCVHISLPFYILLPLPQDLRQLDEPSRAFMWVKSFIRLLCGLKTVQP